MVRTVRRRRVARRRVGGRRKVRGVRRTGRRRLMASSASYGSIPRITPATKPYTLKRRGSGRGGPMRSRRRIDFGEGVQVRRVAGTRVVRGTQELSRFKERVGVPVDNTKALLRSSVPTRVLRFHGVKESNVKGTIASGFFHMPNTVSGSSSVGVVPLYVLSLNGTTQASIGTERPLRRAQVSSTGRVLWDVMNGKIPSSTVMNTTTDSDQLFMESYNVGAETDKDYRLIANEWEHVKLAFYGAQNSLTTFYVELIQCDRDYASVEDESELFAATGTHFERYRDEVYGYWQNKIKKLVSNSIVGAQVAQRDHKDKPYKTLKKWRFDVKPVSLDEADTSPNLLHANLFLNDGRICNYQWVKNGRAYDSTLTDVANGVDDALVNSNYMVRDNNVVTGLAVNVHPRGRRYLVISATSFIETPAPGTAANADETVYTDMPSFDLIFRKKEHMTFHNEIGTS